MKANKNELLHLLNTAKGQIDGLCKMIDKDEYCINISNQILATIAVLKKANANVLFSHLNSCVINAKTDEEKQEKTNEIISVLNKIMR